ncbi:hypothetical protein NXS19_003507 [Fusarium pseudograminearum]|nr:hypothetical protein NXS19_003507 [Fusarium pseudograminearum]
MSLRLAAQRLAVPARTAHTAFNTPIPVLSATLGPTVQRRHKWASNLFKGWGKPRNKGAETVASLDPTSQLDNPKSREEYLQKSMYSGVEDNIFQDEIETASPEAAPWHPRG